MRVHVNDISSISHITYHNGMPCNKYTATITVTQVGGLPGRRRWYLRIYANTETALMAKLSKYTTDNVINIPTSNLYDNMGVQYGKTRNAVS